MTGKYISIEDVPDPTFAEKMMGDGFAVEPLNGKVVSPVSGEIIQVFPTKHAIGIKTAGGAEILIHIGIDSVTMKGDGFTTHVEEGDRVEVGDPLVDFDVALVEEKAASIITPVVVTNQDELDSLSKETAVDVIAGETPLLTMQVKS